MKDILFLFNPSAIKLRCVLLNDFTKLGLNVKVALPKEYVDQWRSKCPNLTFVPFEAFSGTSIGIFNNLKTIAAIYRLLKEVKPDSVFFGNVKPNIFGGIAARMLKIRHIYGLVSGLGYAFIDMPGIKRYWIKKVCMFLYKLSFKHFTHVFFQNIDDLNFFVDHQLIEKDKASVVNGTGVDLALYKPLSFPENLTFLMAARLIKEKGVFHYVESAKYLKEKYPHVHFLLVGGIDTNPSAITIEQLKTYSGIVDYRGYSNNMLKTLEECSVFVYPSYYREGVPRAILEVLACGKPVITTDGVGCKETVVDGVNGFKISSRSTESLIDAMERFIQNPELIEKMGVESRKLAESKFDIHKVNDAMAAKVLESN